MAGQFREEEGGTESTRNLPFTIAILPGGGWPVGPSKNVCERYGEILQLVIDR